MSRYLSQQYAALAPYTPGEQPQDMQYIKLNTNESPFPPSPKARAEAEKAAARLHLYSDPESRLLTEKMAETLGVGYDNVLMTNGSDEILNFAFMAFCDKNRGAAFADITYGFYSVFGDLHGIDCKIIPLDADFRIRPADYMNLGRTIFIANPNAPTGIALSRDEIETIVAANPDSVVVIDEAYVDFGGESAVPLIRKYDNLLVTQTFSKSRSLAGGRLGMGIGAKALIDDLKMIKYSTNPYNVNAMTAAAGLGVLCDPDYTARGCRTVMQNRDDTARALTQLGFFVLPSSANFLFVKTEQMGGEQLYCALKERGVLVRHFTGERIRDYNRITVGSREQMDALLAAIRQILGKE